MAEKEYIEREALIEEAKHNKAVCQAIADIVDVKDIINNTPAADVVEVVRCKDCKHYDKKYHQCKLHSEEPDQYYTGFIFCIQEDDFCSYGERKELDNDKT